MTNNNMDNGPGIILQPKQPKKRSSKFEIQHFRHHYMFRTHPDINTARMTFHHQLSIQWQVCTPPHFNLQYTQPAMLVLNDS